MDSPTVDAILSQVIGEAYPPTFGAAGKPERLARRWIVRFARPVDAQQVPDLVGRLVSSAREKLRVAYAASVSASALEACVPLVSIIVFDERYAIVTTEFPEPKIAVGDTAAIGQIGVLQNLDSEWHIEDLQGLPRHRWFFLRARE